MQYSGTIAGLSALLLAFLLGQSSAQLFRPIRYQFLVTNSAGYLTPIKSVPSDGAQTDHVLSVGDTVYVDCAIKYSDGTVWYRLSDAQGWLKEGEVGPAPFTGQGVPPRCPQ